VSRSPLGLAVLLHELLRGACGNVEDIQDMPIEIPRRHFGFERSQQSAKFHRFVEGACVPLGSQRVDAFPNLGDRGHVFSLPMIWISAMPSHAHHTPVLPDGQASSGC
jgi:hypothetical protein